MINFWFIFCGGTEKIKHWNESREKASEILGSSCRCRHLRLKWWCCSSVSIVVIYFSNVWHFFQHFYLFGLLQAHFEAGVFQIWVKHGSIFKAGESRAPRLGCQDLQCKCSPRFENKIHKTWRGLKETSLSVMDKWKACRMWLRRTLKEHPALNSDSVWLCKFTHANTDTLFCTVL